LLMSDVTCDANRSAGISASTCGGLRSDRRRASPAVTGERHGRARWLACWKESRKASTRACSSRGLLNDCTVKRRPVTPQRACTCVGRGAGLRRGTGARARAGAARNTHFGGHNVAELLLRAQLRVRLLVEKLSEELKAHVQRVRLAPGLQVKHRRGVDLPGGGVSAGSGNRPRLKERGSVELDAAKPARMLSRGTAVKSDLVKYRVA
jgi:hypothetical protein